MFSGQPDGRDQASLDATVNRAPSSPYDRSLCNFSAGSTIGQSYMEFAGADDLVLVSVQCRRDVTPTVLRVLSSDNTAFSRVFLVTIVDGVGTYHDLTSLLEDWFLLEPLSWEGVSATVIRGSA